MGTLPGCEAAELQIWCGAANRSEALHSAQQQQPNQQGRRFLPLLCLLPVDFVARQLKDQPSMHVHI
jgi:hypothetical protein